MNLPTITRGQFAEAIHKTLNRRPVDATAEVALVNVAVNASEFTFGNFDYCPMTQAGYSQPLHRSHYEWALAFDDVIGPVLSEQLPEGASARINFILNGTHVQVVE